MSKRKVAAILLAAAVTAGLSGQTVTTVTPQVIKLLSIGDKEDQLGVQTTPYGRQFGLMLHSSESDKIVVNDIGNERINIYDQGMNLIRSIVYRDVHLIDPEFVDGYGFTNYRGHFLGVNFQHEFVEADENAKRLFYFSTAKMNSNSPPAFWPYVDMAFYYTDDGQPGIIAENGSILDRAAVNNIVEYLRQQSPLMKTAEGKALLEPFLAQNNLVICRNRLLSSDAAQVRQFVRLLQAAYKTTNDFDLNAFLESGDYVRIDGYDLHDSLYLDVASFTGDKLSWQAYVVVNKYGKVLNVFTTDLNRVSYISVFGDLIMEKFGSHEMTYEFSKIPNTWDPIAETEYKAYYASALAEAAKLKTLVGGGALPTSAVLSSLSASSAQTEPTDKNAYHPVKLFDGDPKTMWIENALGPGIGESVTVGFAQPVTVDEIQFEPGCFWPEYWKQNYRVKQLEVKLDDKTFTANFNDQMVVQSLKLPSAVTFTTALFTIKDVYPTTKWEDTAISEIAFYNHGAKIDVDYSKYKDFLKKAP